MAVESTERVMLGLNPKNDRENYYCAIRKSYLISADMAHAIHPNYPEKHNHQHAPKIHEGIVLKINCNQRYMTDSVSAGIMRFMAQKKNIPLQDFVIKQDLACGSTTGPIIAAKAGIKTIDVGVPQLAMHSIREICGVIDLVYYRDMFGMFFEEYGQIQ